MAMDGEISQKSASLKCIRLRTLWNQTGVAVPHIQLLQSDNLEVIVKAQ